MKLTTPKFDILEEFALKFAMEYYEVARSQGIKPRNPKHKTARLWALHRFTDFLPKAVEVAIEMLTNDSPTITKHMKDKIYLALMERINDPVVNKVFGNKQLLPGLDLKKMLENAPAKPVEIKTDIFDDKRSVKNKLLTGVSHG